MCELAWEEFTEYLLESALNWLFCLYHKRVLVIVLPVLSQD